MQSNEETKKTEEVVEAVNDETTEKETASHKAKRYLRVIAIFVVFFVGGSLIGNIISEFFTFDKAQQQLLKGEIAQIGALTNESEFDTEALNKLLEETVTSDEYIPLEKAMKAFTKDVINVTATVDTVMNNKVVEDALTNTNIAADGPEFKTTLAELDKAYKTLEDAKVEFERLMTEETILSYLPEDTDKDLVKAYKEIISGIKMTPTDKRYIAMITSIEKRLEVISVEKEAIQFLIDNKGQWTVEGENIKFTTQEQVDTYNGFIAKFQELIAK